MFYFHQVDFFKLTEAEYLHIGGIGNNRNDVSQATFGLFHSTFTGCIRNISLDQRRSVLLKWSDAETTENLLMCRN